MLIPSIYFPGNCDEAIQYYKEAIGAEVQRISYFRDAPPNSGMEGALPPNFVMYSEVLIFGTRFMLSDGGQRPMKDENFGLQLTFDTADEVTAVFNKLAEGGRIIEPLAPQFWTALNGNVEDRFGVHWNILVMG